MISNSICSGKVLYEIYVPAYGLSWWTCHMHLKNQYILQFLCTVFCKCQLCQDGSIFETCVLIDSCLLGILINAKDVKNLWLLDLCLWICLFFPFSLSVFVSWVWSPVNRYIHCYVFLVNCLSSHLLWYWIKPFSFLMLLLHSISFSMLFLFVFLYFNCILQTISYS